MLDDRAGLLWGSDTGVGQSEVLDGHGPELYLEAGPKFHSDLYSVGAICSVLVSATHQRFHDEWTNGGERWGRVSVAGVGVCADSGGVSGGGVGGGSQRE
jgi:hypothetical protein